MRPLLPRLLACAAIVLLCAPLARAEDEPAEPLVEVPSYSVSDLAPGADERPASWRSATVAGAIPDSAPSVQRMFELAVTSSVDAERVNARCLPLLKGEGASLAKGVLVLVDVDEGPAAFRTALDAAATANGWRVRELGSPMRLGIVWGSPDAAATELADWQAALAVTKLSQLAFDRVVAAGQAGDREEFQAATRLLDSAGGILPSAGIYHALKGRLVHRQGTELALEHFRKALADGAPAPAPARWAVQAAFELGQMLLLRGSKDVEAEALTVLEKAVQWEAEAANPFMRFGNRYNLACAHARVGQVDKAFPHLEESLRFLQQAWLQERNERGFSELAYPQHYEHARTVDGDLAPLRSDARFAALMEKYAPTPPSPKPPGKPSDDEEDDEGDDEGDDDGEDDEDGDGGGDCAR